MLISLLLLFSQIAISKIEVHTYWSDSEYQGNAMADVHAKSVTQEIPNVTKFCTLNEFCKIDPNMVT